jgi:hypothetical protein
MMSLIIYFILLGASIVGIMIFLKLTIACYLFIKGFRCAFTYNIVVQVHFLLTLNAYSEFCCKFLCDCDMV